MKISKVTFEGTPEEFKTIGHIFTDNPPDDDNPPTGEVTTSLDPKVAYKAMLKRIPIPKGQKEMYKTLAGGEHEYGEYVRRMGRTRSQIAGLHGALGRRINNTEEIHQAGLPGNMSAVTIWRNDDDKVYLSLKPDFLDVLLEVGIV